MKFSSDKQHIYYSTSACYYFYSSDESIYVRISKNDYIYSDEKIDNNILDYSIAIDDTGILHFVSINKSGDLKYCAYKDERWNCKYLTRYDASTYRFKNLKVFVENRKIHILVAMSNLINTDLWTIKHHFWNTQTWSNKKICSCVIEKYDLPYEADMDSHNNIHLVFKSLSEKKYQLYYCRYQAAYHVWNLPIKVSSSSHDISYPFIICDDRNSAHLVWSSFVNNNMKSFYAFNERIDWSRSQWSDAEELTIENGNQTHPILLQIEKEIRIVWRQDNNYFYKSKNLVDNNWSKINIIKLPINTKLKPISILGYKYKELSFIKAPLTYGFVKDTSYIAGLDTTLILDKDSNEVIDSKIEAGNDVLNMGENYSQLFTIDKNKTMESHEKPTSERELETTLANDHTGGQYANSPNNLLENILIEQKKHYDLLLKIQEEQVNSRQNIQNVNEIIKDMVEKCPCCEESMLSKLKNFFLQ